MDELEHLRVLMWRWHTLAVWSLGAVVIAEVVATAFAWRKRGLEVLAPYFHRFALLALVLLSVAYWRESQLHDTRERALEQISDGAQKKVEAERNRAEQAGATQQRELAAARAELARLGQRGESDSELIDSLQLRVEVDLPTSKKPAAKPRGFGGDGIAAVLRSPDGNVSLTSSMQVADRRTRGKVNRTILVYEPQNLAALKGTPIRSLARVSQIELDLASLRLGEAKPAESAHVEIALAINGVAVKLKSLTVRSAALRKAGFSVPATELFATLEEQLRRARESGAAHVAPSRHLH
jgi:hypothetical protein